MSDYQRLVSYIYSYPGGTRDKNVGFAKAEVRNGQFKLNVSLKGVYTDTPETFGVHLLVEDKEKSAGSVALLLVGNVIVKGGAGQYADLLNPSNISGSGYQFEDVSGIAIARQDNDYYRMFSLWKDMQIKPELVKFLPKDYKKYEIIEQDRRTEEIQKDVQSHRNERIEENVNNESDKGIEHGRRAGKDQSAENYEEPEKVENAARDESNIKEDSTASVQAKDEHKGVAAAESVSQERAVLQSGGVVSDVGSSSIYENVQGAQPSNTSSMGSMSSVSSMSGASGADMTEPSKMKKSVPGEMGGIFDNADFIDVFGDDYYYDCVEVTPEQLQSLPIEDRAVVSNSFLEHGYYNFKHLLFGKVRENERHTKYFIGVPGMYCNRERFMATMFGYGNFKRSHRADCSNPYFGYWYQEI